MTRLIPSLDSLPNTISNSDSIKVAMNLFEQWIKSYYTKKEFVDESEALLNHTGPQGTNVSSCLSFLFL